MFEFFNNEKMYYSYKGIKKTDFPKWQGWKIIDAFKKSGIHVSKINDEELDILFENFVLMFILKSILEKNKKLNI